MEAATLLTLASAMGLHAGCVAGVVVNRMKDEHVTAEALRLGEENAVAVAVLAAAGIAQGKVTFD